jgi:hypothetical protein
MHPPFDGDYLAQYRPTFNLPEVEMPAVISLVKENGLWKIVNF